MTVTHDQEFSSKLHSIEDYAPDREYGVEQQGSIEAELGAKREATAGEVFGDWKNYVTGAEAFAPKEDAERARRLLREYDLTGAIANPEEDAWLREYFSLRNADPTMGSVVAEGLLGTLRFAEDFAIGGALMKGAGKLAAKLGIRMGASAALEAGMQAAAEKSIIEQFLRGGMRTAATYATAETGKEAAAALGLDVASDTERRFQENLLYAQSAYGLDEDTASGFVMGMLSGQAEVVDAARRASLQSLIEGGSEGVGGALGRLPVLKRVTALQHWAVQRLIGKGATIPQALTAAASGIAYDGLFQEVLEERAGDVAMAAAGLMPWSAVVPDLNQIAAEMVSLGLPAAIGLGGGVLAGRARRLEAPGLQAPPEAVPGEAAAPEAPGPAPEGPAPAAAESAAEPLPVPEDLSRRLFGIAEGVGTAETPEQLEVQAREARRGRRVYFAHMYAGRGGLTLPTGEIILPRGREKATLDKYAAHESVHQASFHAPVQAKRLLVDLERRFPEEIAEARESYLAKRRIHDPEGPPLGEDLEREEAAATLAEAWPKILERIADDPEALRDVMVHRRFFQRVLDMLARVARSVGIKVDGPAVRRLRAMLGEEAGEKANGEAIRRMADIVTLLARVRHLGRGEVRRTDETGRFVSRETGEFEAPEEPRFGMGEDVEGIFARHDIEAEMTGRRLREAARKPTPPVQPGPSDRVLQMDAQLNLQKDSVVREESPDWRPNTPRVFTLPENAWEVVAEAMQPRSAELATGAEIWSALLRARDAEGRPQYDDGEAAAALMRAGWTMLERGGKYVRLMDIATGGQRIRFALEDDPMERIFARHDAEAVAKERKAAWEAETARMAARDREMMASIADPRFHAAVADLANRLEAEERGSVAPAYTDAELEVVEGVREALLRERIPWAQAGPRGQRLAGIDDIFHDIAAAVRHARPGAAAQDRAIYDHVIGQFPLLRRAVGRFALRAAPPLTAAEKLAMEQSIERGYTPQARLSAILRDASDKLFRDKNAQLEPVLERLVAAIEAEPRLPGKDRWLAIRQMQHALAGPGPGGVRQMLDQWSNTMPGVAQAVRDLIAHAQTPRFALEDEPISEEDIEAEIERLRGIPSEQLTRDIIRRADRPLTETAYIEGEEAERAMREIRERRRREREGKDEPPVRYALLPKPEAYEAVELPEVSKLSLDNARRAVQDLALPIQRWEEQIHAAGGNVERSVRDVIANMPGRIQGRHDEMRAASDKIEEIGRANRWWGLGYQGAQEMLGDVLYATAAPERNQFLLETKQVADGSGMSNAEADAILDEHGSKPGVQEVVDTVRKMLDETRAQMLSAGLISQETYDFWMDRFPNYVPMRTAETDAEGPAWVGPRGRGFVVTSPIYHAMQGRSTAADNPLVFAFVQGQSMNLAAEKARVGGRLWEVVNHPDNLGLVSYNELVPPENPADWTEKEGFGVWVNGERKVIKLSSPDVNRAMRGLVYAPAGPVVRLAGAIVRLMGRTLTQWNVDFIVPNFERDAQEALVNLSVERIKGIRRNTLKSIPGAARAIFGHEFRGRAADTEIGRYYEEVYRKEGGLIGWARDVTFEQMRADLLKRWGRGLASRTLHGMLDTLASVNAIAEQATRVAAAFQLEKAGVPREKAIRASRELTVDFNRRGEWTSTLAAWKLFINARIQGTTQILINLKRDPSRIGGMMAGIAAAAFGQAMLNYYLMGDDDDGENIYLKKPDWERESSAMLPNPLSESKRDMIKWPLPYGYSIAWVLGDRMAEAVLRNMEGMPASEAAAKVAERMAAAAWTGFSPVSESTWIQMFAPSILQPLIQVAENKDWHGGPIMPSPNPFDPAPEPDSERYWPGVSPLSKNVAQWLNRAFGGNKNHPGKILGLDVSMSPEALEHVFSEYLGGIGDLIGRTHKLVTKPWEETGWEKVPAIRRFYSTDHLFNDQSIFYENLEAVHRAKKDEKDYGAKAPKRSLELADLYEAAEDARSDAKKLREEIRATEDPEKRAKLNEEMREVFLRFNKEYNKVRWLR